MIEMNVKRGHRRLIQRQISTFKGISQDQPLVINVLSSKHPSLYTPVKYESCKSMSSGYETLATGLTSPKSMSSAVLSGNTSASGNSSSADFANTIMQSHNKKQSGQLLLSTATKGDTRSDSQSSSMSSNDDNESVSTNDGSSLKRKYRRHPKPDRKAPVKPPSAYIMFSNDSRAALKDQNLSFAELAKIVGDQWKNLSHSEKQNYERMAMRAKDEFLAAVERYKLTPEYAEYQTYLNEFKLKQSSPSRSFGRRKRAKKEPSSGNSADVSSNGNSNGSGSTGSTGSTDSFVIKGNTEPQQVTSPKEKSSNNTVDGSNAMQQSSSPCYGNNSTDPSWDYRCSQMMKGIIPVEFSEFNPNESISNNLLQSSFSSNDELPEATLEGGEKRRSPRLVESSRSSNSKN
ncbi:hypothetical protein K501DRAFT_230832 [Backusella circina FSU 941]|nr:hypothetical protein K501DRAFT_230832 [Backusella circina FSU 941]